MPVIKSYFKTTEMTEEQLESAVRSSKDQENKIYQLFKKYSCLTSWDVYDLYNELIGPILMSSVGRSMNTLQKMGVIVSIGNIPGDAGRPVNLYELVDSDVQVIDRKFNIEIPKSIKIDLVYLDNGDINTEKMVEELDIKLQRISEKFGINY